MSYSLMNSVIVACQTKTVLFVSLEMSTKEIMNRVMTNCAMTNRMSRLRSVPARGLKTKTVNKDRYYWRLQERQLNNLFDLKSINIIKNRYGK